MNIAKNNSSKITLMDILDAMNKFSTDIDAQLQEIKCDISGLKSDISGLKSDVSGLKSDVTGLKSDVNYLKANMVTKDYLDRKLADLRGDIVSVIHQEDDKLMSLTDMLRENKVLKPAQFQTLLTLRPFPRKPRVAP